MLYPLFFEPVYKTILWGGRNMESLLNRKLPDGNIAESWDICCHKNGMGVVASGELKGHTFAALISEYGSQLVGTHSADMDRFPLLIKIIDANDKLSIQVHPGNEYAMNAHGELGKTEMWYVVDAIPGAQLIYGTSKGVTKEAFKAAILDGTLENKLNYVQVKKGDVLFIPSGTVHAIMEGLLIAEIQQNSDTTYRVYDWNRVDANGASRELHVERALDVINFDFVPEVKDSISHRHEGYSSSIVADCEFFKVEKLEITDTYSSSTDGTSFITFTCVDGSGFVIYNSQSYKIETGASFLIPACCGAYQITGKLDLLKAYI